MPWKFWDVFRNSPKRFGKSSEFQRKNFCTGIKLFSPYSRTFKASLKSIKKNRFSENYTVVLPLKSTLNTFSVRLSRSAESATEAISLALHSVSHGLKSLTKDVFTFETLRNSRPKPDLNVKSFKTNTKYSPVRHNLQSNCFSIIQTIGKWFY